MKRVILMFTILVSIVACKKEGSDNNVEPSSNEGNYLTLADGGKQYTVTENNIEQSYSCEINSSFGASSCFIRAELFNKFKLYLNGKKDGGIEGQYFYKRDTTEAHFGRTYFYHDKTGEDATTADEGIVWWADSVIINITSARFDSVNAFSNRLITRGNYKVWLNYRNTETKVVSGEFNIE